MPLNFMIGCYLHRRREQLWSFAGKMIPFLLKPVKILMILIRHYAHKLKILSTKSLRQEALDTASLHDIEIDELPFIITEPIKDEDLKNKLRGFLQQNISAVFTSKNAMLAFAQIVNGEVPWKIFCIGQ